MLKKARLLGFIIIVCMLLVITGCINIEKKPVIPSKGELSYAVIGNNISFFSKIEIRGMQVKIYADSGLENIATNPQLLAVKQDIAGGILLAFAGKPQRISEDTWLFTINNAKSILITNIEITLPAQENSGMRETELPQLLGDFDGNHSVSDNDFTLFKTHYDSVLGNAAYSVAFDISPAEKGSSPWHEIYCYADSDGKIDLEDLLILGYNWGKARPIQPPTAPTNPKPENNAEGVEPELFLEWAPSIDPLGAPVVYHVSLGLIPTNLNRIASSVTATGTAVPEPLQNETDYYWRVEAVNTRGESVLSAIWKFSVAEGAPPDKPILLTPENGENGVDLDTLFTWSSAAEEALSVRTGDLYYDLYLGTLAEPSTVVRSNLQTTAATLSDLLAYETTYFWKVAAKPSARSIAVSDIFSFTTKSKEESLPGDFEKLTPLNGMTNVDLDEPLTWSESENADYYDVYFGIGATQTVVASTTDMEYAPELEEETVYSWQIVAVNRHGSRVSNQSQNVWSFSTGSSTPIETAVLTFEGDDSVLEEEEIVVSIKVDNLAQFYAAAIGVGYNETKLEFVRWESLTGNGTVTASEGRVSWLTFSATPIVIPEDGIVGEVTFKALVNSGTTVISFSDSTSFLGAGTVVIPVDQSDTKEIEFLPAPNGVPKFIFSSQSSVQNGKDILITIGLQNLDRFFGMDAQVFFDTSKFEVEGWEPLITGGSGLYNLQAGGVLLTLLGFSVLEIPQDSLIGILTLTAKVGAGSDTLSFGNGTAIIDENFDTIPDIDLTHTKVISFLP